MWALWKISHPGYIDPDKWKHLGWFLLLWIAEVSYGQTEFVIIKDILVTGLQKTSKNVVMKEIDFIAGDTIHLDQLSYRLALNEKRLQSIGLFTLADVNVKNWNTDENVCDLEILLQENWYIYPFIIFELADRNFDVWRKEHNYSFDRVNYGLSLQHINFTGNKDKLNIKFQRGYTRKYEISYNFPYLIGRWGLSANVFYSENREIAYRSLNNKPVFYKSIDDQKLFFQHRASIGFSNRSNALINQSLKIEFITASIDDIVVNELNPNYFGNRRTTIKFFNIDYFLRFDKTLYPLYPLGGYRVELNVRKDGLGFLSDVNNTSVSLSVERHTPLKTWLIASNRLKVKYHLQSAALPYYLNTAIGYGGNKITGYQLYVLDGRRFYLSNNAIKCKLLDKNYHTFGWMPRQFKVMNAKLFLRFNFDFGYAYDPDHQEGNPLSNTWQYGYGPGLDAIIFNNMTLSMIYGITAFGEKGFFIESSLNF